MAKIRCCLCYRPWNIFNLENNSTQCCVTCVLGRGVKLWDPMVYWFDDTNEILFDDTNEILFTTLLCVQISVPAMHTMKFLCNCYPLSTSSYWLSEWVLLSLITSLDAWQQLCRWQQLHSMVWSPIKLSSVSLSLHILVCSQQLMDITILSESPELGDLSRALWSGPVCRTHHVSGRQAHGIAFCSLRQGWALIRLVKNSVKLPQKIAKIQKKLPCTFIKWSLPPWKHHIQNWNAAYCCTQLPI